MTNTANDVKGKYEIGKVDYNESGRKDCLAEITWELKEGRFSMQAGIWNPIKTDYYTCGQCVDTVASYFPSNRKVQRMKAIWEHWHLNDMKAGTPQQEKAIKSWKNNGNRYEYDKACEYLKSIGLYDVNGYKYGHAWLKKELPSEVVEEILSWSD